MESQVGRRMPLVEQVVRPILTGGVQLPGSLGSFPGLPSHVSVVTWTPDVDRRTGAPGLPEASLKRYPLVKIRRMGGLSNPKHPDELDRAVIELTAFSTATDSVYPGYGGTAALLLDAQFLIQKAIKWQFVVPGVGHLHSWYLTMGPTQFDSPFDDTWRWQSLIQLGLRPPRQ